MQAQMDKKSSFGDDDGLRLNLSDNNFESFDLNHGTPRHLMIPTTPPFSPGIRMGVQGVFALNQIR